MKKAAFIIATQYDNLGDLIINKCLIDELTNHVTLYVDIANVSREFIKQIKTNPEIRFLEQDFGYSFKKPSILKFIFSSTNQFSYLFKSPGPIFYRNKSSLKDKIRSLVFHSIYKKMISNNGKSFIIGSEITFESNNLTANFLKNNRRFEKFLVRSKSNVDYLKSLNVKNVEYIPDLCFLARNIVNPNKDKTKVGISFRNLSDDTLHNNILKSINIFVDFYLQKDFEVVFFYQVARDHDYTKELFNLHKMKKNVSFVEETILLNEINIYENFRAVLSNRLHVLLLGFIHNSLSFALINNNTSTNKIKGIYESIGTTQLPFTVLEEKYLNEIDNNYLPLIEETNRINDSQYDLCRNKISEIFQN